jgi:eukaryotic-like serine/threonine-protein kinase
MSPLPPPIQHLGRYDIVSVLGQGAMGVVYEGRDPNLDRRVAIKTVRVVGLASDEIAEYEQRFKTEARSAGRLQHPNIVSVYDSDKHVDALGQTAYIVMEFIEGEDLKHFLDQGKRFSLEQTAFMMADLLSALDYAHKHKIVHRDIKPANMLLTKEGRIKLTDFGVARITDSGEATKTSGGTVGTLKYMSPEQVAGKGVDASSDLFSAGIVLYQLLTGLRPFDGDGYLDIVSKIVKSDPKPPSQIVGALPPALDAVVAKALAKSKLDRFADAASFAAALKAAINNADLTITPSVHSRSELADSSMATFPGSITQAGSNSGGSTVTQELELVYWKDIKESQEPDVLEGFLRRFPVGIYADLAKRKLKVLADAEQVKGEQSRYEATQLRKPSDATVIISSSATALNSATAKADDSQDESTLPPSAYNDSEYGASTQFAPTQFPAQEPSEARKDASLHEPLQMETTPAKPPSAKKKKTSSSPPWLWLALLALAVGAAIFWFSRSSAPGAQTSAPAAPTPTVTITAPVSTPDTYTVTTPGSPTGSARIETETFITSPAPVVSGSGTSSVAIAPKATASAPLSPASAAARAQAAARAASAAKALAQDRPASAPSTSGITEPAPKPPVAASAPAPAPTVAPRPTSSAPASAPAGPAGPREACEGRVLLGFLSCMAEQCERSTFRNHPACVERREMEERRRNSQNN